MSKATVLIVEDEAIIAADLAGKLEKLGYEIVGTEAKGEEAVASVYRLKPDVVLMDILLKGKMDGIEAAEAIRNRINAPAVIFMTSYSDDATLERAKLTQPYGYILKPFEERALSATIKMAIYKRQLDRQLHDELEWLRVTLNSIGDAVISCNAEGIVYFLNPVAETLTGWRTDNALGCPIEEVFHLINEQYHLPSETPVSRVIREGDRALISSILVTREDLKIPVEGIATPVRNIDGWIIGVVIVVHAVTEKRRAEEALLQAK
ncbi:MAG: response regulator [Pelovirga sp.]